MKILTINPGATSTKIGVFDCRKEVYKTTITHTEASLKDFNEITEQSDYRFNLIKKTLNDNGIKENDFKCVIGRGGLLKPVEGGVYSINEKMLDDLKNGIRGKHASNLGAIISYKFSKDLNIPAFIANPVSVDEMEPVARVSGLAGVERISLFHALNHKSVALTVAEKMNKRYEDLNFIVAHLGTGVTVGAHKKGRVIDVNDAREVGSFSMDRCGDVPICKVVKIAYSGKYTYEEMMENLTDKGGMYSYLKTKDLREVIKKEEEGCKESKLLLDALVYQISKDIGSFSTVLCGEVDRIILTGGMAYSEKLVDEIKRRTKFIAPIEIVPGEEELESLAREAERAMNGETEIKIYD